MKKKKRVSEREREKLSTNLCIPYNLDARREGNKSVFKAIDTAR